MGTFSSGVGGTGEGMAAAAGAVEVSGGAVGAVTETASWGGAGDEEAEMSLPWYCVV